MVERNKVIVAIVAIVLILVTGIGLALLFGAFDKRPTKVVVFDIDGTLLCNGSTMGNHLGSGFTNSYEQKSNI